MKRADQKKSTANDLTDVSDIRGNLLYTKSNYALGYLKLLPINIDLLSEDELDVLCNNLTAQFKPEKENFSILSIPRTVDMEAYLNQLSNEYDEEFEDPVRKDILKEMIRQASDSVMNGENFEHQYYIKTWSKYNANVTGTEKILKERIANFENRYESAQNKTKEVDDIEILKLCNLYGNGNSAIMESYDENIQYTPIPVIKGRKK